MATLKALLPKTLQRSNRKLVQWLIGMLLLSLWCFVGFWSWWEQNSVAAATKVDLGRLTTAVQEQAKGLFKQAEASLMVARHWIAAHPGVDPGTAPEFIDLVEQMRKSSDGLLDFRMVTRSGVLRYIPDKGQAHQTDVSDRDYFQAQADPKTRGLYIANPVLSRVTGKWGIPISIPVDKAGGEVAVLFAAIELDRIAGTFESERVKPNGTIAIFRQDGTILFRSPLDGKAVGSSIAKSTSWEQYLSVSPKGTFLSPESPVDGASRIVSFARVPGYPLLVAVTARTDDLLPIWQLHTAVLSFIAIVVSLFCLLLGKVLIRAMDSEEAIRHEMEHLMLTDTLTGVGNRRMPNRWLEDEIVRAQRYGRPLTAAFLDLDFFKKINDTYGHGVGDTVLSRVAECLRAQLRQSDHVGRFGGEEFVVLLAETSLEESLPLIERMRAAVSALNFSEMSTPVTVSAGVAQFKDGESGESLLNRSDRALYKAKTSGRNRTCVADSDI